MDDLGASFLPLRLKLIIACLVIVAAPSFMLCLLWSNIPAKQLEEVIGWELQALLVAVGLIGMGMLFYLVFWFKGRPSESQPEAETSINDVAESE